MAVRITRSGVGLTVGIIVLALVVLGGLYFIKERGEQARRDAAIEIAKNSQEQGENGVVPSTDGATSEENTQTSGNEQSGEQTSGEQQGSSSEQQTDEGVSVIPGDAGDNTTSYDAENSTTQNGTNDTPEVLPETGANGLEALLGVSLVTFATASYIASRRALL